MSYKIIMDSAGEINERHGNMVVSVPITVCVNGKDYVDNSEMNIDEFREAVKKSAEAPKSACPSPEMFSDAIGECDRVYIITISSHMSGSYNSARLGLRLFLDENEGKKGHVFDSKNASGGEALIAEKIIELEESGMEFEKIVEEIENYIPNVTTNVVLEDLSVLYKNGRLSRVAYVATSILDIVAVLTFKEGELVKLAQARGVKRALKTMESMTIEDIKKKGVKKITITHSVAEDRALALKEAILKEVDCDIIIVPSGGTVSMYAGEKGLVISY